MEHCFACDTDYGYIGTDPHQGSCPACGSTSVTPAGNTEVVDTDVWESANGLSAIHVTAVDAHSRRFEFEIAARRGRGSLVRLTIDGRRVPTDAAWSVPPSVATTVTAYGIRIENTNTNRASL